MELISKTNKKSPPHHEAGKIRGFKTLTLSISALSLSFACNLSAQIATFNFRVSEYLERPSAVFNDATHDIDLTVTALGNYDWINGDQSGPSLNLQPTDLWFATFTGTASNGFQLSFSFSKTVRLNTFTTSLGKIGNPSDSDFDDKILRFTKADGSALFDITSAGGNFNLDTTHDFPPSVTVDANTPIILTYLDPNEGSGILSWDRITVQVIPEPSTYALWGGLLIGAFALHRRFKKNNTVSQKR